MKPAPSPSSPFYERYSTSACVVGIASIWLIFWAPVLFGEYALYADDIVPYWIPSKDYFVERITRGEFPRWWRHVGLGHPYFADASNQVLYPGNVFFLITDSSAKGISWFAAGHILAAMLGTLRLARVNGANALGSTFAALVLGFSGMALSTTANLTYLPALVWIPFGLSFVRCRHLLHQAIGAGACAAMLILAGDILNAVLLIVFFSFLSRSNSLHDKPTRRAALTFLCAVGVGMGLSAAQWIPTIEIIPLTERSSGFGEMLKWSFPPERILEFIHPYLIGAASPNLEGFANRYYPEAGNPWYRSVFIGVIPFTLVVLSLYFRRGRFWLLVGVSALVASFGRWLPGAELAHEIPLLSSLRYPEKLIIWFTLAISVLSAMGFTEVFNRLPRTCPWRYRAAINAGILAVVLVMLTHLPLQTFFQNEANEPSAFWIAKLGRVLSHGQGVMIHTIVVVALMSLALWLPCRFQRWGLSLVAVLGVSNLLWVHSEHVLISARATLYSDRAPLGADALKSVGYEGQHGVFYEGGASTPSLPRHSLDALVKLDTSLAQKPEVLRRVAFASHLRDRLVPNVGASFGIRQLGAGLSPLQLVKLTPKQSQSMDMASYAALNGVRFIVDFAHPATERWSRAKKNGRVSERYRNEELNVVIWELTDYAPVYAKKIPAGFIEDKTAWCPHIASILPTCLSTDGVLVVSETPERRVLNIAPHQGELTIGVAESFAPGWRVEINGLVGAVKRSPYGLIEFTVPPSNDTSKVIVKYTPAGLWAGVWLTGLTIVVLALLSIRVSVGRPTRSAARQC